MNINGASSVSQKIISQTQLGTYLVGSFFELPGYQNEITQEVRILV